MGIDGITTQSLISQLGFLDPNQTGESVDSSSLAGAQAAQAAQAARSANNAYGSSSGTATATGISKVGYILSNLAKLGKEDPEAFKESAAALAKDFRDAASQCSDTLQRFSLQHMASQFSNASTTGSMSSINLGSTTTNLMRAYAGQSSLTLLDYLNGSQGTDFSGQVSSILNGNLQRIGGIGT